MLPLKFKILKGGTTGLFEKSTYNTWAHFIFFYNLTDKIFDKYEIDNDYDWNNDAEQSF